MLKGLVDAYRYLDTEEYLALALKNANFIHNNLMKPDGGLFHNHKNGKSNINGYLEDYAAVIDAFIGLFEVTYDEKWLSRSKALALYCQENFFDANSQLFFFTSKQDDFIIRRTIETSDNVIPASNSIMAINLFKLSKLFPEEKFGDIALQMLKNVQGQFDKNAQNHANWLQLNLFLSKPFYEIAVAGEKYQEKTKELQGQYLPNTIMAAAKKKSTVSILQNRFVADKTLIYVCLHGSCKLPVTEAKEALTLLNEQAE
jgi:uncharacterized protein YyaL (SSP411 family)